MGRTCSGAAFYNAFREWNPAAGTPPPVFKTAAPLFFIACDYSGILPPTPPRGFEFRDFSRAIGRRSIECDPAEIQPRPRGSSAAGPAAGTSRARGPCLFRSVPPPVVRFPKTKLIFSARAVPDFAPAQLVPVGIRPPVCSAVSGTFLQTNIYSELQFVASVPALALSGRK